MKFWTPMIAVAAGFTMFAVAPIAHADAPDGKPQAQAAPTSPGDDEKPSLGRWMVRGRGYDFVPANHSAPFKYLGINFEPHAVTVSQKFGFEADISYYLKSFLAAELSVSAPVQSSVKLIGGGPIGSVSQSPVTLTLQYHYQVPKQPINLYVGAGFDYSLVASEHLAAGSNVLAMTRSTTGVCYQLGFDVAVAQGFYLNFDFRHLQLAKNLRDTGSGTILTDANMTPNLFAIGIGYRF